MEPIRKRAEQLLDEEASGEGREVHAVAGTQWHPADASLVRTAGAQQVRQRGEGRASRMIRDDIAHHRVEARDAVGVVGRQPSR